MKIENCFQIEIENGARGEDGVDIKYNLSLNLITKYISPPTSHSAVSRQQQHQR